MKKQLRVGLVVQGNATTSPVLRLSCLAEELGPIKSVGLQVARRTSNFLRAGYGITDYKDLAAVKMVLLRLPDSEVPRVVAELEESGLPLSDMLFVLCESWLPADVLMPLKLRGAKVASLLNVGPLPENCFVVEGDLPAVRKTTSFLRRGGARVIELRAGTKSLYFAANLLSTAVPVPISLLAARALRESGVSGRDLSFLSTEWAEMLARRVRKGARSMWAGPLAECAEAVTNSHFNQLAVQDPDLAARLNAWLALADRQMTKNAKSQTA